MSIIKVENLNFAYPFTYINIFENASFIIDTDWKLGLIGRNGKGKTTLLKLFQNEYPYQGKIISSTKFDYFPYNVRDMSIKTFDLLHEIAQDAEDWQIERELSYLEVKEDVLYREFKSLSNGEQTKVMLAGFFLRDKYFHLLDEPTNHLDSSSRQTVANYLKKKKGFILVSHDRNFLDTCVDHILSINRKTIEVQKGNFSSWKQNFDYKQHDEILENQKLNKQIEKMEESIRQTRAWANKVEATKIGNGPCDRGFIGKKSALMMQKSKAIENRQRRAIEKKSNLLKDIEETEKLKLISLNYHSDKLIELNNVVPYYGSKNITQPVSFVVNKGDRVVLCGKNGCGKSTIMKLILGHDIDYSGEMYKGNLKISYIPQDSSFLKGSLYDFICDENIDKTLFLSFLRKLDFERSQFEKPMDAYSMGQKKKVLIAKSLCEQAHLYVWDEPLNYIDFYSRIQIEQMLQESNLTLILVEHDEVFQQKIGTKFIKIASAED